MNQYKRNEIALYITFAVFLITVGVLTGDYINYVKMMGLFFGIMGAGFLFYKSVLFLLNKMFPTPPSNTSTLGGAKTYIVNFDYEKRN